MYAAKAAGRNRWSLAAGSGSSAGAAAESG